MSKVQPKSPARKPPPRAATAPRRPRPTMPPDSVQQLAKRSPGLVDAVDDANRLHARATALNATLTRAGAGTLPLDGAMLMAEDLVAHIDRHQTALAALLVSAPAAPGGELDGETSHAAAAEPAPTRFAMWEALDVKLREVAALATTMKVMAAKHGDETVADLAGEEWCLATEASEMVEELRIEERTLG